MPDFTNWPAAGLAVITNCQLQYPDGLHLTTSTNVLVDSGRLIFGTGSVLNIGGNLYVTNRGSLMVYAGPTNELSLTGAVVSVSNDLCIYDGS